MIKHELGNINNDAVRTPLLSYGSKNTGFSVQVSGRNLTGTITAYLLTSLGGNTSDIPSIDDLDDWSVLDSLQMQDGSSFFSQGDFWGKYLYVLVDGSGGGTLDNVVVYYNQDE